MISVARNKVQTHCNAAQLECFKEKWRGDVVNENFGIKRLYREEFKSVNFGPSRLLSG